MTDWCCCWSTSKKRDEQVVYRQLEHDSSRTRLGGVDERSTVGSGAGTRFSWGAAAKPEAPTCCQKAHSVATGSLWSVVGGGVIGGITVGVAFYYDAQWSKDALTFVLELPGSHEIMAVITIIAAFAAAGLLVGLAAGVIKEGCCPSQSSSSYQAL